MTASNQPVLYQALDARKQQGDEITRSMVAHLGRLCERLLSPGDEEYIDYQERRSEWWRTRPGGRKLPAAIERLAAGGILINPRYGEAATAILRTIVEQRIVEACGGTNYGRPYHTWRDNPLDAGVSSHALAIGLDLLRPGLDPDELQSFGGYLIPFVDYVLDDPPDPDEAKPDWNIALIGYVGTALLALTLNEIGVLDHDRRDESLQRARRRVLLFLDKGHDGDGAFYEGPAYGSASVHYALILAFALARRGDRTLVEHPGLASMVQGLVYELIPGTGQVNPLNDCGDTINVSWVSLIAAEQQSGLAQWLWQHVMGWPPAGDSEQFDWTDAVTRFLLYYDPSVTQVSPDAADLPRTRHFRQRGLVDVRSGWERHDTLLSFLCDVYPAGGHRQADRNHFAFHALEESFAIDAGYALERMPGTTEVLRRGAMGEAHNLPLVHGRMQVRGQVAGDGIVRLDLASSWPYIESEAGESYAPGWGFRRRIVCLPDEERQVGCVLVSDRMTFDGSESRPMLSWLLHTAAGNSIELQRDRFTLVGGKRGNRCDVHMVTPWPGRWRQEEFLDHPRLRYDWFWNCLHCLVVLVPYGKEEEPPAVVAEGTAAGCALTLTLRDRSYTVLSAAGDEAFSFDGMSTDADLAVVQRGDAAPWRHLLCGGTQLSVSGQGQALVNAPEGVEYVAST
jgi:hypothetical protein